MRRVATRPGKDIVRCAVSMAKEYGHKVEVWGRVGITSTLPSHRSLASARRGTAR